MISVVVRLQELVTFIACQPPSEYKFIETKQETGVGFWECACNDMIGPSSITFKKIPMAVVNSNNGLVLFGLEDIPKYCILGEYTGEEDHDQKLDPRYGVGDKDNVSINCQNTGSIFRFIEGDAIRANVQFMEHRNKIYVVTTSKIYKGTPLFNDYDTTEPIEPFKPTQSHAPIPRDKNGRFKSKFSQLHHCSDLGHVFYILCCIIRC
jgi:hypothetical protein